MSRSKTLQVRVSPEEKRMVHTNAKKENVTVSEFLYSMLIERFSRPSPKHKRGIPVAEPSPNLEIEEADDEGWLDD